MPHAQNTNPFCVAPWSSLVIEMDGHVYPCCQRTLTSDQDALGNIHEQSLLEIWKGQKLQNLREKNGFVPFCAYCVEMGTSPYSPMQYHKSFVQGELFPPRLQYLGIKISNHCLSSCRICGAHSSTAWLPDTLKIDPKAYFPATTTLNEQRLLKELEPFINELKHIYLAGGEPLIEKTHLGLLAYLLDKNRNDIQLHYNSSLVASDDFFNQSISLWKKFNSINMGVSIDAKENQAEYLRKGCQWNVIEERIRRLKEELPHINLFYHVTLSIFNLYNLPDLLFYFIEKEGKIPNINFSFLKTPSIYDIQNLPEDFKAVIKNHYLAKIQQFKTSSSFPSYEFSYVIFLKIILTHLGKSSDKNVLKLFWAETKKMDAIRNEKFEDYFPEYYSVLKPFINS